MDLRRLTKFKASQFGQLSPAAAEAAHSNTPSFVKRARLLREEIAELLALDSELKKKYNSPP